MQQEYWLKQRPGEPLFKDIEWQKPEQKTLAGKLLVIGGNAHGFAAVAQAYQDAFQAGIGECRVLLPDALKKSIQFSTIDTVFAPTNASGGIAKDSLSQLEAAATWADGMLLIGDAGRNSETAILCEQLLAKFSSKPTVITRDAVDLIKGNWPEALHRHNTVLVVTFAQLQKIFQSVYYPKTLLFSMQLANLVEALHKFTITYPVCLMVFHQNHLLVAQNGQVCSMPWQDPMLIWRGSVAASSAVYVTQQPQEMFKAAATSMASFF